VARQMRGCVIIGSKVIRRGWAQRTTQRVWHAYVTFCAIIVALTLLYVFYAFVHYRYRYVALPNGLQLHNVSWFDTSVVIRNANGDEIVGPNVAEVVWNDRFIRGWRFYETHAVSGKRNVEFIYHIGAAAPIYKTEENFAIFHALELQSALSTSKQISRTHSVSLLKNYLDLINDPHFRRNWYE